ncbi:MAG: site-specific integrase [Marinobacter sp.]
MNDKSLNDILEQLIDPPYGMLGIQRVAEVLSEVLQRAWLVKAEMEPEGREKPEFLDLIPELRKLCGEISTQSDGSGRWIEKDDAVKHFKTSNPIYSAMFELSKSPKPLSGGRLQLVSHGLVAAHMGVPITDGRAEMPKVNIQDAFRELRRLGSPLLDSVVFELPSRWGCYESLKTIEHSGNPGFSHKELEGLGKIRRLLGLSLGLEVPLEVSTRRPSGAQVEGLERGSEVSPDQLGDAGGEKFYLFEASLSDLAYIEKGQREGLAPKDVVSEVPQLKPSGHSNPRRGGSQQHATYKARHIKNQMRRAAQPLTGRWDRLTEFDIASSISMLSWPGAGQNPGTIAAGLVLLSSRPLAAVLKTRLFDRASQLPKHPSENFMAICFENAFIQVSVPVPERSRQLRMEWYANLVPADDQLRLPIVRVLWDLLVEYLGSSGTGEHGYLFPQSEIDDIKKSAESIIADVRLEDGARLTETRLQRCLYNEIADVLGDTADAVFITGNQPSVGTHVGIHYYCVSEADLQDRYLIALRGMVPEGLQELMVPVSGCSSRDHFIGSPMCPTLEWLRAVVSELRAKLAEPKRMALDADHLIELHNRYTLYFVMFMAMATGYRSVQAPLSRSTDYDPLSGMLVVADKTDSAFSHARLVPVPDILARQLDLYNQHRERVADRMWAILGIEEAQHFLFFLSKASRAKASQKLVRVVPVTSEKLKSLLKGTWDLPLNVNRHYMRSELRHRGVHGELVDAWMGHWLDGQEPMGRYSTLSPIEFAAQLEPVLSEILEEMGWSPEGGLS